MYWQYTTALASFVLTATNPEIRTDAVSTNVSFVFIVIPPIGDSVDSTTKESAFCQLPPTRVSIGDMFDCGPTITRYRTAEGEVTSYFASFSFAMTSSRLKLAAFCRCGYSRNDARNWPT
jgi:hypothetical protein